MLDACLAEDPDSKVACETATKTGMVMVFGEITTKAKVDYEAVVRKVCNDVGFTSEAVGLDGNNCRVLVELHAQSPEIGQGVHGMGTKALEEIGAGDQGIMFGYATDESEAYAEYKGKFMPMTLMLANAIGYRLTEVRKNGTCPWVRPDGKTQVTIEYKNEGGAMRPQRVHTVLISTQHDETVSNEKIAEDLMTEVIKKVIPADLLDANTIFHLNPSGRFTIGGPDGDAGLTGRKIIIDTYGGWGAHGGGAFSGKDPTKVDRSAAYACRWMAKSVVKSGLCKRALVQLSYAIGVAKPLSLFVETYGTENGELTAQAITNIVKINFDARPGALARDLALRQPKYNVTAAYCHFGREPYAEGDIKFFAWEDAKDLSKYAGMKTAEIEAAVAAEKANILTKWVD